MAEIITAFSVRLAEFTVDQIFIQIKYPFVYKSKIQTLRDKMVYLENRRNCVQRLVDAAENNAEDIRKEVSAWLQMVDKLKENAEVEDLMKKVNDVLNGVAVSDMSCLFNRCPNLKSRYLLSRRATKLTIEVDKLKEEGELFEKETVSYPQPPVQVLNRTLYEEFETRLSVKEKIKEALRDKEISIIGICGMPGVGKTTLAKEIVNEVTVEKLFEEVAFAVVSEDPDIDNIQDQLAEMLGLTIVEKMNKDARAGRLRQRLERNNGKSVLVILDDVWKDIDLGTIGIPSPRDREGLKIMFTTRNEDTCTKMKAEKFNIEVLSGEEGWQLFKDMAGISDDGTDVELISIAQEVAKECGGLPLALVVVGKALNNKKDAHKWRDALQQLQKSSVTKLKGMHELVYSRIELSYNYLESNEDRDLLLLCSLFAEDESIPIEDLVKYARGLELFPNTETLYETRYRAYSIADDLKSCFLLQPGKKEDEVKLHDVIRDFCLQKATKEKGRYLVNHAGLKEWPELDTHDSRSAVSITFDEQDQLRGGLNYRNVKLLRVICRYKGKRNNFEEFFQDMNEFRVVELKRMNIQIPSSIQLLTGLRTLCLISCKIDFQLSMIGSLKKLEILCFYDSYFGDSVPIELANLSNLKSLDLRFRKFSCPLVPGVLSGMKKLEELYLGKCIPMEGEDQRYIIIQELRSLTSLRAFQISTRDTQILKQILGALSLKNLENFDITISEYLLSKDRVTKSLYLSGNNEENLPSCLQPEINSLMKTTYHLQIEKVKVLKNVVSELDGDGFINLKTLDVSYCDDFEYLIDAANSIPSGTFGKLESLQLQGLPKLTEICNGNLPWGVIKPPLFFNLMVVRMIGCGAIRSLFRESVAKCLVNLESLQILRCPMLEEVVSTQGEEVTKTCIMLEFPKLKSVDLTDLSRFKSFTSQSNSGVVCQTLFNQLLQNLERLEVEDCEALEVLFDIECLTVTNDHAETVLGRLESLHLKSLAKLVHITRMVPKGILVFEKLGSLVVERCGSLKYLFSPSTANSLVALKILKVSYCESIEEIVGKEEEGTSETNIVEGMKISIVFPNLNRLTLKNLPRIQMFCSQNYELKFPSMKSFTVKICPMMSSLHNSHHFFQI